LKFLTYFKKEKLGPVLALSVRMENLIFIGIVILGLVGFLWMAPDRSPDQDEWCASRI